MLPFIRNKKKSNSKKKNFLVGLPAFNPLTYDSANLLALYNGDVDLSNIEWKDQSAGANHLTLFNLPTVVPGAVNGHQAVRFDGINQYGQVVTPARNQPHTLYLVIKQISWTNGEMICNAGTSVNAADIQQFTLSSQMRAFAGSGLTVFPDIALGNYDILTTVFNGALSQIRTNNNVPIIGNLGIANAIGLTVGARQNLTLNANCEFAFLIERNGADSTVKQDKFINYFKNRFAI